MKKEEKKGTKRETKVKPKAKVALMESKGKGLASTSFKVDKMGK
jgi:hypothetical protein